MRQKKEFERAIINLILNKYSIPKEKCIDSERPDFVVNNNENGVIGIEVVSYLKHNHAESDLALTKIICDYNNELDKKLDSHCYISVHFRDRVKLLNQSPHIWWLSSAYTSNGRHVYYVTATGTEDYNLANISYGLAPAFCI